MLLYCGLREEEALAYLGVGEPLDHVPEDLPLAGGEGSEVRGLLFGQQVPKQFTRRNELALRSHCDGTEELVRRHPSVDETGGPCLEGVAGERQIQVRAEDQDGRRIPAQLPELFHVLGEVLLVVGAEYDAGGGAPRRFRSLVNPRLPLQGSYETHPHHRREAVDPDHAQELGAVGLERHVHGLHNREEAAHSLGCVLFLLRASSIGPEDEREPLLTSPWRIANLLYLSHSYVNSRGYFF